ncbi:HD domain-containing protein [Minwuia sp.]|uniref:HD domain-containing protein n=1 Tax=Minwuia sp. TaxID=2493630 RepID=UPI003A9065C5
MADNHHAAGDQAQFHHMRDGTLDDWQIIARHNKPFSQGLADRLLTHLQLLKGDFGGFAVDRLEHSLQTATKAHQAGEDEEYVVCALLHDIGDMLASYNHADLAATILHPFVSEENHWMVEKHGIFQGYYFFHHLGLDRDMREQFRGHPAFQRTADFCEKYDAAAFDPNFESMPLEAFRPMVARVVAKPKRSIYKAAVEAM